MAKKQVSLEYKEPAEPLNCVARTFECFENQGFKNFKVLTLHIEEGVVVKVERSDPWVQFEAVAKQEIMTDIGMMNLNTHWAPGKCLSK